MSEPKPMLSVAEALDFLLTSAKKITETETLPTLDANGRILAVAQESQLNVPPVDNTSMAVSYTHLTLPTKRIV